MSGGKTRTRTLPEGSSTQPRPGDFVEIGERGTCGWDCGVVLRCAPAGFEPVGDGDTVVWLSGDNAVNVGREPLRPWNGRTHRWPKKKRECPGCEKCEERR